MPGKGKNTGAQGRTEGREQGNQRGLRRARNWEGRHKEQRDKNPRKRRH